MINYQLVCQHGRVSQPARAPLSRNSNPLEAAHRARFASAPFTYQKPKAAGTTSSTPASWRNLPQNGARWTASQWLENSAQAEVAVPLEHAWSLWEDRTRIPQWMPWITSVTVLDEDPRMSRWMLSTEQFNRQWEFSWKAQNLTPLKNQKIHWRSVPGSVGGNVGALEIQNKGQIRFARKGSSACSVRLTISYEVPNVLAPFAQLLTPVVEGILDKDMQRFKEYAAETYAAATK